MTNCRYEYHSMYWGNCPGCTRKRRAMNETKDFCVVIRDFIQALGQWLMRGIKR
jgi:hypothetical protein